LPPGNIYIIIRQFDKTVKIYFDSNVNEHYPDTWAQMRLRQICRNARVNVNI